MKLFVFNFYRICKITSVDNSNITCYCVHECDSVNRVGMRSRRFVFTGHVNGSVQVKERERGRERDSG